MLNVKIWNIKIWPDFWTWSQDKFKIMGTFTWKHKTQGQLKEEFQRKMLKKEFLEPTAWTVLIEPTLYSQLLEDKFFLLGSLS